MITLNGIGTFAFIVGLLTVTPGLDTALILRTAALGHRRRAWGVVLGIQSGTLTWGVLTSLGVTALLTVSHLAYEILRWAGAAYLVWMGGRLLWGTWCHPPGPGPRVARDATGAGAGTGGSLLGGWRQGFVTNLLNPKMGAFYVAILPQFLPAGGSRLVPGVLLAGVHILLAVVWACALIAFARMLRGRLQRPSARRLLDRVTGTVIAAFGIRLALGQ
ncbi:LysE family translocator [Streptomyces sp. NPDC049577]|uniref:LysE family translocator n=1 Tax=Streptomyces sp. NPDC049577 TaxID=3155153 RepID=UPI0034495643